MDDMVHWMGEVFTREEFETKIAPLLRERALTHADLLKLLKSAENQRFRLNQLCDSASPNVDRTMWKKQLEMWDDVIPKLEKAVKSKADTLPGPDAVVRKAESLKGELAKQDRSWLSRIGDRVSNVGRYLRSAAGRALAAGRQAWQQVRHLIGGVLSAFMASWRAVGLRAALAELLALAGGPWTIIAAVIGAAALALLVQDLSRQSASSASASAGGMTVQAILVDGDTISLMEARSGTDFPLPARAEILAGPGPWREVHRQYCEKLDRGSLRRGSDGSWSASFRGRRVVLLEVDVAMTEDCGR